MPHAATRKRFSTVDAYATEVAWNLARHHHYSPERARRAVNGAEVLVRESYRHGTDPAFLATRLTRGLSSGTKKVVKQSRAGYARGRAPAANEGLMPEAIIGRRTGYAEPMLEISDDAQVCTADPQQPLLALPSDQFDPHEPMGGEARFTEAENAEANTLMVEVTEKWMTSRGVKDASGKPVKTRRFISTGVISALMEAGRNMLKNPKRGNAALDALARILSQPGPHGRVVVPTKKGVVGNDATWMSGGAQMIEYSGNRKLRKDLSEVSTRVVRGGLARASAGPSHEMPEMTTRPRRGIERMTSTTIASIAATCPTSCVLMGKKFDKGKSGVRGVDVAKDTACYVLIHQNLSPLNRILSGIASRLNLSPTDVARDEANCIDASFKEGFYAPFDLRIHTAGDTRTREGARIIAAAVRRWQARGGGSAWGYTHAWKDVHRSDWGSVSILASVQNPAEAAAAKARGWFPTCVVKEGVFHALAKRRRAHVDDKYWVSKKQAPKKPKDLHAGASESERARYMAEMQAWEEHARDNPSRMKLRSDDEERRHREPIQSLSGDFGAFRIRGDDTIWIPCPAQNPDPAKQIACVNCRMCMNDQRYIGKNVGIAFEAHGSAAKRTVTYDHGQRIVQQLNARVLGGGEIEHDIGGGRAAVVPARRRLPVLK